MAPIWSGMTTLGSSDNFMTGRSNGLLTYRNSNFFGLADGLNFAVQYQGKNDRDDVTQANGDGVGYSLGYDFGEGFSVIGAYSNSNRTTVGSSDSKPGQKADGRGSKAEAWAIGTKYDANNVYLAATYAETRNLTDQGSDLGFANKTQNLELVAQYQFDFGLRPAISYVQTKGKNLNQSGTFAGGSADMAKFIQIGTTYYFNKNFNVYADYLINLLDKDSSYVQNGGGLGGVGADDQFGVGVTYQF
ncbi:Porin OmpF [Cedecea neteri]|nr:Porin OmpF [Cedecea neteri]